MADSKKQEKLYNFMYIRLIDHRSGAPWGPRPTERPTDRTTDRTTDDRPTDDRPTDDRPTDRFDVILFLIGDTARSMNIFEISVNICIYQARRVTRSKIIKTITHVGKYINKK